LRAAAQSISYEIPLALAALAIAMIANGLSTVEIVNQQADLGILSWNVWRQPVGFVIFIIAALAECERLPFDLPEAEEELVAGYQTEYTGMKFALFYGGSYANLDAFWFAGGGAISGRLGIADTDRFDRKLAWVSPDHSLVAGNCWGDRYYGYFAQSLFLYFLGDSVALDSAPGADRSAVGSGLEIPIASQFG
jgi:hypothetical protein